MVIVLVVVIALYVLYKGLQAGPLPTEVTTTGLVPTFVDLSERVKEVYVKGYRVGFVERRGDEWVAFSRARKEKGRAKTPDEAATSMLDGFEVTRIWPT